MLSIICIFMKELVICMLDDNDSLLFFYINMKFCLIKVSCILILNGKFVFCSKILILEPLLEIINIV